MDRYIMVRFQEYKIQEYITSSLLRHHNYVIGSL